MSENTMALLQFIRGEQAVEELDIRMRTSLQSIEWLPDMPACAGLLLPAKACLLDALATSRGDTKVETSLNTVTKASAAP